MLEGPISGCVVQLLRCRCDDTVLLSGRVAAGIDDGDQWMQSFVAVVWHNVLRTGRRGVVRPDGQIDRNYLVGNDAREKVVSGDLQIADRAVRMLYRCPDTTR
jgi:hypothetical protein